MHRLALIADELGEEESASKLRSRLSVAIEAWLMGQNANPLQYEPTYGGARPALNRLHGRCGIRHSAQALPHSAAQAPESGLAPSPASFMWYVVSVGRRQGLLAHQLVYPNEERAVA